MKSIKRNARDDSPEEMMKRIFAVAQLVIDSNAARRESALLGMRVQGGVKAKRDRGGYHGKAPDGYINVSVQTVGDAKKINGRFEHWIEQDPEWAPIVRFAWDLLLGDLDSNQERWNQNPLFCQLNYLPILDR